MIDDEKGYNGWTNYETWCVNLWLSNDEGSYGYWQDMAAEIARESGATDYLPVQEVAKSALADRLKDEVSELPEALGTASMFVDLLNTALGRVNWGEIAENLLEDAEYFDGEEENEED